MMRRQSHHVVIRFVFTASLVWLVAGATANENESWNDLTSLGQKTWRGSTGQWLVVGDARLDPEDQKHLIATAGSGVLWNGPDGSTNNLITTQEFGDVAVQMEFMVPAGSNSGVKFHGLYEIQILDSWGVEKPTASDCGGIYPRAELKPTYHLLDEGVPPKTNAARPPGAWQTLEAIFQSPRFDSDGKKVANARFVKVALNGTLIHQDVEVPTPTGHAWRDPEHPVGPLLIQGDHGPIAVRKLRVRRWDHETVGASR